jgi:hypothetical protein
MENVYPALRGKMFIPLCGGKCLSRSAGENEEWKNIYRHFRAKLMKLAFLDSAHFLLLVVTDHSVTELTRYDIFTKIFVTKRKLSKR